MIGVQDVEYRQCAFKNRIWLILQLGCLEHHVEEVAFVAQIIIWIRILHPNAVPKCECCNRRHLRYQTMDLFPPALFVEDVFCIRIESRKRTKRRFEHAHRMCVVVKPIDYFLNTLVDERMVGNILGPLTKLWLSRQLT